MHPMRVIQKAALFCLLVFLCRLGLITRADEISPAARPNIIFILADDLGYGDPGCYGQTRIRTPNLDRLAREGMRLTQHYSGNAVCAPSRCVLMTGLHPGHAFIRDNREIKPEGQLPLPAGTVTLPKLLGRQGYVTGAFGKWGLGGPGSEGDPLRQGFDRFFGYNCQRLAHNFYPTSLWDNAVRVKLNNPDFSAHDTFKPGEDPNDPKSYQRFQGHEYSADLIAERALQFVRDHRAKPFFLYWPTTVPHLALQVPDDSLREYEGLWEDPPYTGGRGYIPHFKPRAAYAAMVTRLDREVGRMLKLVSELGLEERTLFIFTSDNGPLFDRFGGTDSEFFKSTGELRGRKGSLYEGGIRVPCLVRWKGRIAAGAVSRRVTGFEDWLPTLLELIHARDAVPAGLDGISFAPTLLGQSQQPRPFLYREFPGYGGQQSIRVGDWKGVRQKLIPPRKSEASPQTRLELYDLAGDPSESSDVSASHPEMVAKLERLLRDQHRPSKEFPIPALDHDKSNDPLDPSSN